MMDVIHKIFLRAGVGKDLLDDVLMILKDLLQGIGFEAVPGHQIEELSERKPSQIVTLHDVVKFRVLFFQPHDTGSREDDFQFGVVVVAFPELHAPIRLLEHLIDQKHLAAFAGKLTGKLRDAFLLKVEVVHIDIEALPIINSELLLGILEEECGLSYTSRTLDADHAVIPVDLVHKDSSNRRIGMLDEV